MEHFWWHVLSVIIGIIAARLGEHGIRKAISKGTEVYGRRQLDRQKPLLLLAEARDWIEKHRDSPCKGCGKLDCLWCRIHQYVKDKEAELNIAPAQLGEGEPK